MTSEIEYVKVPTRLGVLNKKRSYIAMGSVAAAGKWLESLWAEFGAVVAPAQVWWFVPVSRAAVYKRIQEGKLTLLVYLVDDQELGREPHEFVALSECKQWAGAVRRRRESTLSKRKTLVRKYQKLIKQEELSH